MSKVLFIDPQSYMNLEKYDVGVMSSFESKVDLHFACSSLLTSENEVNGKVYRYFNYSEKKGLAKVFSYIYSMFRVLILFIKLKPNILHLQWSRLPLFDFIMYKLMAMICPDTKFVFTAHNIVPHDITDFSWRIYKLIYKVFDVIITHEKNGVEKLNALKKRNAVVRVIKHGLIPFSTEGNLHSDIRSISFSDNTFLFVGFGNYYKGLDILLETWLENYVDDDDKTLIIAGKVSSEFEALIRKCDSVCNVKVFDRYIDEVELKYLSENSTFAVLPYREISQSGVLLSVLAHKLPVIVANKGGLTEPMEVATVGVVVNDIDQTNLKNAINNVCIEPCIYKNESNWIRLTNFYDWKSISKETLNLYKS